MRIFRRAVRPAQSRWIVELLALTTLILLPNLAYAQHGSASAPPAITATHAVLIDYENGSFLYEKAADTPYPPASLTKLMTMELVFQALEERRISIDEEVLISPYAWKHGGANIWQTPAIDPDLGLIYFSTGQPGPQAVGVGANRPGDNLFSSSIVAVTLEGKYAWHFQQVHHDLWDFDCPSPVILFEQTYEGRNRKAIADRVETKNRPAWSRKRDSAGVKTVF